MKRNLGYILLFLVLLISNVYALTPEEELYQKVFGIQKQPKITKDISIPISLDGEQVGLAQIALKSFNGKQSVLANKRIFIDLLESVLSEDNYEQYVSNVEKLDSNRVEVEEVVCCGIKYYFDEESLSIDIETLPEARKKQVRYLRNYGDNVNIKDAYKPSDFSGSFSLYVNQPFGNSSTNETLQPEPFNLQLSSFLNYKGLILENTMNYVSDGSIIDYLEIEDDDTLEVEAKKSELIRDYTTLSKVFEDYNSIVTLGDIKSELSGYTSGPNLLGASLQKRKDKYNFNKRESLRIGQNTIFLENDSLVEIYINDTKRYALRLKAGTHDLVDFTMDAGVNNIEIKITDIYGKISYIKYDDYFYGEILKEGEVEYGVSFGKVSTKENSHIIYLDDLYFLSSSYTRGFKDFTYNFSFQKSNNTYLAIGSKIIYPTTLGIFEYSKNITSFMNEKAKSKDEFKYKFSYRRFLFTYGMTEQEEGYSVFSNNTVPTTYSESKIISSSYSFENGNRVVGMYNSVKSNSSAYEKNEVTYLQRLSRELELELKYNDRKYEYGGVDNETYFVSLRWSPMGKSYRSELSRTIEENYKKENFVFRGNYEEDEISSYSYDLSLEKSNDLYNSSITLGKTSQKYKINADITFDEKTTYTQKDAAIKFETGLVFADNNFAFTTPKRDSFVLIDNLDKSEDIPAISLTGYDTNSKTSAHSFTPFTMKNLEVDETNLPMNINLTKSEYGIISSYKSGVYIPIDFKKSVILKMYMLDDKNMPLSYQPVEIINKKTGEVFESFTNKKGRLVFSDADLNENYIIKTNDYTYEVKAEKPENSKSKRVFTLKDIKPI